MGPFKGSLDWPVDGRVRQLFASASGARPPLRGIEIEAAPGSAARVVHDGTVAFADEFTGYGRLVIVDHGSQTFSLYGNLGDVLVTRGARLERGAAVGTLSGAAGDPAVLYFELRIDGRAADPLQWLAKR